MWQNILSYVGVQSKDSMSLKKGQTQSHVEDFNAVFEEKDLDKRIDNAQSVTKQFYDLVTDFYEYGWGQSFHFAPRFTGEEFHASIARHEYYLSNKLDLKPGDHCLDAGCGVMGPARAIARFSGAKVTGLNLNDYQVHRCEILNAQTGIPDQLAVQLGDFTKMPFPDNTFDKAYAIEAFCHAPKSEVVYEQLYNKVKPGGKIALYEWAMTDKYDPTSKEHQKIKFDIEKGNSICELETTPVIDDAIRKVGFEVNEAVDLAKEAENLGNDVTWFATLQGGCSLAQMKHTLAGRQFTHWMVTLFEAIRVAPEGTVETHKILIQAAEGLVKGGELGIFTPMYLVVATKPMK